VEQKTLTELKEAGVHISSRVPCLCGRGCSGLHTVGDYFLIAGWALSMGYVLLAFFRVI
jgi:hypothetical protein